MSQITRTTLHSCIGFAGKALCTYKGEWARADLVCDGLRRQMLEQRHLLALGTVQPSQLMHLPLMRQLPQKMQVPPAVPSSAGRHQ